MTSSWPKETPNNIIVRMPNWLGDLVMATPVLQDLKSHYPNARITAMCQSNVAALLKNNPYIDEIYSYKKPSGWVHRRQHLEIIESIRRGDYDLGVLLTNSISSAWWFWRGNVRNRIGYATNLRSFLLNKAVPFPEAKNIQHLVITYKMLLEPLGIKLSDTDPQLFISDEELDNAKEILRTRGIELGKKTLIGINPGAAFGSAKCWLPERFVEVTKKIIENPDNQVVYFGDPTGAPLVNEICKQLPSQVVNLAGKTNLRELVALISLCNLFLTNDSGPMHIAAALQVPLLALFGSTSEVRTGPYKFGKIIHKHVECSPCYKRVCPIDFRCMKRIEVDEVYAELEKIKLKQKNSTVRK